MEGLKHGAIVVELGKWGVKGDEKGVVDTWVANVVADGGDEQGEGIGRGDEGCER